MTRRIEPSREQRREKSTASQGNPCTASGLSTPAPPAPRAPLSRFRQWRDSQLSRQRNRTSPPLHRLAAPNGSPLSLRSTIGPRPTRNLAPQRRPTHLSAALPPTSSAPAAPSLTATAGANSCASTLPFNSSPPLPCPHNYLANVTLAELNHLSSLPIPYPERRYQALPALAQYFTPQLAQESEYAAARARGTVAPHQLLRARDEGTVLSLRELEQIITAQATIRRDALEKSLERYRVAKRKRCPTVPVRQRPVRTLGAEEVRMLRGRLRGGHSEEDTEGTEGEDVDGADGGYEGSVNGGYEGSVDGESEDEGEDAEGEVEETEDERDQIVVGRRDGVAEGGRTALYESDDIDESREVKERGIGEEEEHAEVEDAAREEEQQEEEDDDDDDEPEDQNDKDYDDEKARTTRRHLACPNR